MLYFPGIIRKKDGLPYARAQAGHAARPHLEQASPLRAARGGHRHFGAAVQRLGYCGGWQFHRRGKDGGGGGGGGQQPHYRLDRQSFYRRRLGNQRGDRPCRRRGRQTLEPFRGENGSFSYTPGAPPEEGGPAKAEEPPPQPPQESAPETGPAFSRCITVFFENGSAAIISGTDGSDEGEILAAAQAAVEKEAGFGYLGDCDLFYLSAGKKDSAKVSLFPARYLRASLLQTSLYLLCAFALTMLACYGISRYISRLAVRPVEQAMNREKQFVADISHDLKPPLAVMQACRHILMENPGQTVAQAQAWLDRSGEAMENMQSLIDDMLALSAMDSGQRLPKREPVNFSAAVTKAALQMEAMAYDRGVALETDVQDNVFVTGDAEALLRAVSGLIENALKYEPRAGRVRIALSARGRKAVLTVQNFGTVIAPEDLPHVFGRFYRSDKARTAQQGHGLGLAIIQRSIQLMNGKIEAASAPETGTVFTVTL